MDAALSSARAAAVDAAEREWIDGALASHLRELLRNGGEPAKPVIYGAHGISMPEALSDDYRRWLAAHATVMAQRAAPGAPAHIGTGSGAPIPSVNELSLVDNSFRDSVLYNALHAGLNGTERAHVWSRCAASRAPIFEPDLPRSAARVLALSAVARGRDADQINLDLLRGFPGLDRARPDVLVRAFRLLRAYISYNARVGYVQARSACWARAH